MRDFLLIFYKTRLVLIRIFYWQLNYQFMAFIYVDQYPVNNQTSSRLISFNSGQRKVTVTASPTALPA